jgi:hypothetical protein
MGHARPGPVREDEAGASGRRNEGKRGNAVYVIDRNGRRACTRGCHRVDVTIAKRTPLSG